MPAEAPTFAPESQEPVLTGLPTGDLSQELTRNRNLPFWRKGLIAATALASGLTAAGASSPALAGGFQVTGSGFNPAAECVEDDLTRDNPLSDNPDDKSPFIVWVYKPKPPVIAAASTTEVGSLAATVVDDDQTTETADADSDQDIEIAIAPGVILVSAPDCEPEIPILPTKETIQTLINQKADEINSGITIEEVENSVNKIITEHPEFSNFAAPFNPSVKLDIKIFGEDLVFIKDGYEGTKELGDDNLLEIDRTDATAHLIAFLASVYGQVENDPELKKAISETMDQVYDYGSSSIGKRTKKIRKMINTALKQYIASWQFKN